jgi:HSP20 family protein
VATKNLALTNRHSGFHPWASLREEMMDFFDRFSSEVGAPSLMEERFSPRVDVEDTGASYEIRAEIPGMTEKDITVSLSDNQLIIEGEKKDEWTKNERGVYQSEISYGSFYRSIPLRDDVDPNKVEASYRDGVLCVSLTKLPETQSRTKKIRINSSGARPLERAH